MRTKSFDYLRHGLDDITYKTIADFHKYVRVYKVENSSAFVKISGTECVASSANFPLAGYQIDVQMEIMVMFDDGMRCKNQISVTRSISFERLDAMIETSVNPFREVADEYIFSKFPKSEFIDPIELVKILKSLSIKSLYGKQHEFAHAIARLEADDLWRELNGIVDSKEQVEDKKRRTL